MVQLNIQQAQYHKGQDWIRFQKPGWQETGVIKASKAWLYFLMKEATVKYREWNELIITDRCFWN